MKNRTQQFIVLLNKVWRLAAVFLIAVLLKYNWITLITANCKISFVCLQLQSTIDDVSRQRANFYVFMLDAGDYVHV